MLQHHQLSDLVAQRQADARERSARARLVGRTRSEVPRRPLEALGRRLAALVPTFAGDPCPAC